MHRLGQYVPIPVPTRPPGPFPYQVSCWPPRPRPPLPSCRPPSTSAHQLSPGPVPSPRTAHEDNQIWTGSDVCQYPPPPPPPTVSLPGRLCCLPPPGKRPEGRGPPSGRLGGTCSRFTWASSPAGRWSPSGRPSTAGPHGGRCIERGPLRQEQGMEPPPKRRGPTRGPCALGAPTGRWQRPLHGRNETLFFWLAPPKN